MTTGTPARIYASPDLTIWSGDARSVMSTLPAASADALITDPPYGLSTPPDIDEVLTHWEHGDDYTHARPGMMQRKWDSFVPGPATWREALRVVKPGAPAVVFAGSRTLDLMMASMRMAGWVIDGTRHWRYGSALAKSLNISAAIAKEPGGNDEASATWDGWRSALKPAHEPMILAYAPGGRAVPVTLGHPYTPKAPADERVVAYLPNAKACSCWGDPHSPGADPDIAVFVPTACVRCGVPYVEYRHPTVKPLSLTVEVLVSVCPVGGVALDPFSGTGTTGIAAIEHGREAVLADLSPVHAAMSRHRIPQVQPSLFEMLIA